MNRPPFYRELLIGHDALSLVQRRTLCNYLTAVVRQRGFPLNVANLWNALYFGYDLDEHGYFGDGINIDRIPVRQMGRQDRALPAGGFVRVQTATRELWAEVVYKEGRHPDIGLDGIPGLVPPRISGAQDSSMDPSGRQIVREALVLDYSAFGPDRNDLTPVRYARLLRKGRWLDHQGHLMMDAAYEPGEAELDDATFYARYLFDQHREGLLAACLEDRATEDDVWTALLTSLRTIGDLAAKCPELVSWRGYFFDATAYSARKTDQGADTRFGADDLARLFKHLISAPGDRTDVAYTAIGPLILDFLLGSRRSDSESDNLLEGPKVMPRWKLHAISRADRGFHLGFGIAM